MKAYLIGGMAALLLVAAGCTTAPDATRQPPPSAAPSTSAPAPAPAPPVQSDTRYRPHADPDKTAVRVCKRTVAEDSQLDPSLLTFTKINTARFDRKHGIGYQIDGYINGISFDCNLLTVSRQGHWDGRAFDVSIGGVDMNGDY